MSKTVLTLAQIPSQLHDKDENIRRMRKVVRATKGRIVIFPELNLTGYLPRDDLFKLAETAHGPSVRAISKLAKETRKDIVFGAPIRDDSVPGMVYNSAVLASGDGSVHRYDKVYLPTFGPFEEKVFFTPGKRVTVAKGMHATFGLMVCYDMFFPELSKLEALMGAQILVNLSAAPTTSRPSFEKVMPARAAENGVFLAYVNLVGVHGSLVFSGGSMLYGPRGDILARGRDLDEDVVEHGVDFSEVETARRFRPLLRDSRADVLLELARELGAGLGR